MKTAFRRHPLLVGAFAIALALALFFAVRLTIHTIRWEIHAEEPIEGWMTVGYVGRSWRLDPREIDRIAGLPLPEEAGRPLTLARIAADRGVPVAEIIAAVEAAVAQLRAAGE